MTSKGCLPSIAKNFHHMQKVILRAACPPSQELPSYAEGDFESNIPDWFDANKFIIPCNIQRHCIALILDVSHWSYIILDCHRGSKDLAAVQLKQHLINSLTHYMSFYFNTFDSGKGIGQG